MFHDDGATAYAARLLIDHGPGSRLDAFLHLAGQEFLWRGAGPVADFVEAVRRYEAARGRALPRGGGVARRAFPRLARKPEPRPRGRRGLAGGGAAPRRARGGA